MQNKIKELEEELKEIQIHLADMLEVALYFAGAKKEALADVANLYIKSIDEVLKDKDEDEDMSIDDMINIINYVKKKYPDYFN